MEMKRIKEESYESIVPYLDVLYPLMENLQDLYFVYDEGKKYVVAKEGDYYFIVEPNSHELESYVVKMEDEQIISYSSEEYAYEYMKEEKQSQVIRTRTIDGKVDDLLNVINAYGEHVIAYSQYSLNDRSTCVLTYDLKNNEPFENKIIYINGRKPTKVFFKNSHPFGPFSLNERLYYILNKDMDAYYRTRFHIKNYLIPNRFLTYDIEEVIGSIGLNGYSSKIPTDLINHFMGNDIETKKLRKVIDFYKSSSQK